MLCKTTPQTERTELTKSIEEGLADCVQTHRHPRKTALNTTASSFLIAHFDSCTFFIRQISPWVASLENFPRLDFVHCIQGCSLRCFSVLCVSINVTVRSSKLSLYRSRFFWQDFLQVALHSLDRRHMCLAAPPSVMLVVTVARATTRIVGWLSLPHLSSLKSVFSLLVSDK